MKIRGGKIETLVYGEACSTGMTSVYEFMTYREEERPDILLADSA